MAKPSPKRFPPRPVWPKRSARLPNASTSGNWAINCWRSMNRSANCGQWRKPRRRPRKKTVEKIQKEVAREVDQLLRVIFRARRKTGHFDLEAIEMAVRSAIHHARAAALPELP